MEIPLLYVIQPSSSERDEGEMGWTLFAITVNDRRLRHLHPRVEQPDQAQRQQQDGHHRRSTQPASPPSSPRLDREIPCARSAASALPTSKFRHRRVPLLWIRRRRPPTSKLRRHSSPLRRHHCSRSRRASQ
ncbi:hypothetical protein DAI22_05g263033 [Oryza sativa Japonica Group]|nr:hypothetical protein DAI22_05g263033 [Oryza sativa Japonica Group]